MTVEIERGGTAGPASWPAVNHPSLTTPAGLEAITELRRRRIAVLSLNLLTWTLILAWAGSILAAGGWTPLDMALLLCIGVAAPWTILGFWNAVIGFWQLRSAAADTRPAAPFLDATDARAPLTAATAVVMTLRNEDPERALLRLRTMKASLDETGEGARFSYFVLSDTDHAGIAAREASALEAWRAADANSDRIHYRRRDTSAGHKAGNIRDFVTRLAAGFELMLLLDADSLMTGSAVVDLVRIMERHPKIGILQSLVVGTPSTSAFARVFQFGMRLAMRTYTMGQAWWVGDCGPFWGHNAILRVKPFAEHCALPTLPGKPPLGGEILSHDQIEAVLMRRAGYEVRVMSVENGSFEDNPPDVLEFIRRDARWCQGNLQYLKLLAMPGLQPVSRFQLLWAILMFAGVPALAILAACAPLVAADAAFPKAPAVVFAAVLLLMHLTPKLAAIADAMLTPGEVARFAGSLRFAASAAAEIIFALLLGAITTVSTTVFMASLLLGRSIAWNGQRRDGEGVRWSDALSAFWPQLVFGLALAVAMASVSGEAFLWGLPLTAALLLAVPFAVLTASPSVGSFLKRHGIAAIPEDFAPPPEVRAVTPRQGPA